MKEVDNYIDSREAEDDIKHVQVLNEILRCKFIPERVGWFWAYLRSHKPDFLQRKVTNRTIMEQQYSLNTDEAIRNRFEELEQFHLGEVTYNPARNSRTIKLFSASSALKLLKSRGPFTKEELRDLRKKREEERKTTTENSGVVKKPLQKILGWSEKTTTENSGVSLQKILGSKRRLVEKTNLLENTILFSNEKREDEKTSKSSSTPFSNEKKIAQSKLEQDKMNRIWKEYLLETQKILEFEGYDSNKVKKYLEREVQARINRINKKTGENRTCYIDKTYQYYEDDWEKIVENYINKYPSRDWYFCNGCDSKVKNKNSYCSNCQNQKKTTISLLDLVPNENKKGNLFLSEEEREFREAKESFERKLKFAQMLVKDTLILWEKNKKTYKEFTTSAGLVLVQDAEQKYFSACGSLKEILKDQTEYEKILGRLSSEVELELNLV